jgi:uncharacterized protein (TIGR03790 family)
MSYGNGSFHVPGPGFPRTGTPPGRPRLHGLLAVGLLGWSAVRAAEPPTLDFSGTALGPYELAVVVNENDPLSLRVGAYYQHRRGIPDAHVIRVRFPPRASNLPRAAFERIRREVERRTPPSIQGYALAWTAPYRVDCMSITSAFALGFDPAYCSATPCATTRPSGYFDAPGSAPYTGYKLRPAMLLAGRSFEEARALIDRGVASDHTYPQGTGYLLNTSDPRRSVRTATFGETRSRLGAAFRLEGLNADFIRDRGDVLFYFTGLARVKFLDTLRFPPGAVADHLTSAGGRLTDSGQMSSLRWLEAGATASYGTVVEPCNVPGKFPVPGILMWHYATGNTVLEAYWKSVAAPGEGVFVGEPLAKPFAPKVLERNGRRFRLKLFSPGRGWVGFETAASPVGPYHPSPLAYPLAPGVNELNVELPPEWNHYRLAYRY